MQATSFEEVSSSFRSPALLDEEADSDIFFSFSFSALLFSTSGIPSSEEGTGTLEKLFVSRLFSTSLCPSRVD